MAPGCYTMEQQQQSEQQPAEVISYDMLIINESCYDLDSSSPMTTDSNNSTPTNKSINTQYYNEQTTFTSTTTAMAAASETLKHTNSNSIHIFTSYHHEINLDSIPLPTGPYPHAQKATGLLQLKHQKLQQNRAVTMRQKMFDTVDSFEILEQTIMKQKRVGRAKNVDLRKKILLKRTFDLVCEIMDHENGFEEDEAEKEAEKPVIDEKTPPKVNAVEEEEEAESDSDESDDESENSDDEEEVEEKKEETKSRDDLAYFNSILSDETENLFSLTASSQYLPATYSTPSLKRKHVTSQATSSKKAKLQRRPSNSEEEDEESESSDEEEDSLYAQGQENFICLYDDDNDPFGIADVVNSYALKH